MEKTKTEQPTYILGSCDYGHMQDCIVRRLELADGAGIFLCKYHWQHEMAYRVDLNRQLDKESRWPILKF